MAADYRGGTRDGAAGLTAGLTDREREVLQLLAEGRSTKQIGAALGISIKTVETHRRRIMSHLQFESLAELTKFAIRNGITSVEK